MTTLQNIKKQAVSAHDVKQFLLNNADFFVTHKHLLPDLEIPHNSGKAVSLIERQVTILRDQKRQLKDQLKALVQIAKENDALNRRLHKFAMALYQVASVEAVLEVSRSRLKNDYDVDESNFLFFVGVGDDVVIDSARLPAGIFDSLVNHRDPEFRDINNIISEQQPVCGRFKSELTKTLFGNPNTRVKSAALLPLVSGSCFGLLCIGSYNEQRFHVGKGTDFLKNLSELISCSLKARL